MRVGICAYWFLEGEFAEGDVVRVDAAEGELTFVTASPLAAVA